LYRVKGLIEFIALSVFAPIIPSNETGGPPTSVIVFCKTFTALLPALT
jgi:hypothetical protein